MTKFTKFLVGAVVAVAVFASSASASYTHTGVLKMGMTSSQVQSLQKTLNGGGFLISTTGAGSPGMESMYFGSKTKAAVMSFQVAKGLMADGVVGAQTGTALAAMTGGSVAYPAGCSSTTGYSTSTGLPCTSGASTSLPAGCVAGAMFSSTTGASCTGGSTTTGPLSGTAGDITVSSYSSGLETQVGEGATNKKVLGFEVKADAGSDISLSSVKVNIQKTTGSGSTRLNRYATNVSIWNESGVKVGSSSVSDFSESSSIYSRNISLSNVVVRADQKARFFVSVDAVSNIDSGDQSTYFSATLDSTRFSDASGAILTDNTSGITKSFQFTSLASANDIEMKVNLSSSNLKAQTVKVSTTSQTNNVELLKFTIKAQGSKMNIDQIPVLLTSTTTGVSSVTGNVTLKIDGQSFSESVSGAGTTNAVIFNDLNLTVAADDTITGTVYADINSLTGNFIQGEALMASIPSSYVTTVSSSYFDVEDTNGDQLATGDRSGSATGEVMTFRSTGVNTVMGSATTRFTPAVQGGYDQITYTIPVSVTSFGNTLYVGQTAVLASSNSASTAFAVAFQKSSAPSTDVVSAVTSSITLSSSDAVVESNGYRLDDGQTKHFTITVNLYGGNTAGSYRVALKEIATFTNAGLGLTSTEAALLPVEQYQTGYELLTK